MRHALSAILSRLPQFKGIGRITLAADSLLTDETDPASYIVEGTLNGGRHFTFDLRAWGQKFAFYYRRWEWPHVAALRALYRGGVFLDIGSSLGLYPVSLGREIAALHGSIISIEPVPDHVRRQAANLRLNGLEELVTLVPVGLGDTDGQLSFRVDSSGADNNAFFAEDGDVIVPIRRLDDVMAELGHPRITLVKIDVEGYEPKVIAGGRETIRRDLPVIFAEFCRERMDINRFTMSEPWEFLTSCGYRCFRLVDGLLVEIPEPLEHQDLYFLPSGIPMPASLAPRTSR